MKRTAELFDTFATGFRLVGERAEDTQRSQRERDERARILAEIERATLNLPITGESEDVKP